MALTSNDKSPETEDDEKCQQLDWINVENLIVKWNITSKTIDRVSRRLFPITFLTFNLIYWLTYAVFTKDDD